VKANHMDEQEQHISVKLMQQYVNNELTAELREQTEQHLEQCELCLQRFMEAVENSQMLAAGLPALTAAEYVTGQAAELYEGADESEALKRIEQSVMAQLAKESLGASTRPAAEPRLPSVTYGKKRRRSWVQHPAAQYTIAASITLLLIGSGSFSAFTAKLAQIDQHDKLAIEITAAELERLGPTWSDEMLGRTSSWIDSLQSKRFK